MLKKLSEDKLITYTPYKGSYLTEEGVIITNKLINRKKLWKEFLIKQLNFQPSEAEELSTKLKHITSETLDDKLKKINKRN